MHKINARTLELQPPKRYPRTAPTPMAWTANTAKQRFTMSDLLGIRMASFSFFRTTLINTVLFPAKFRSVTMNKNSKYESGKFINESG